MTQREYRTAVYFYTNMNFKITKSFNYNKISENVKSYRQRKKLKLRQNNNFKSPFEKFKKYNHSRFPTFFHFRFQ